MKQLKWDIFEILAMVCAAGGFWLWLRHEDPAHALAYWPVHIGIVVGIVVLTILGKAVQYYWRRKRK